MVEDPLPQLGHRLPVQLGRHVHLGVLPSIGDEGDTFRSGLVIPLSVSVLLEESLEGFFGISDAAEGTLDLTGCFHGQGTAADLTGENRHGKTAPINVFFDTEMLCSDFHFTASASRCRGRFFSK